ncbi:MAG TPA: hypothetical protein VL400_10790 [Polyangiaceae bacterium]|nr:hypothetical protein [Polyangiaceae bacterium]
MSACGDSGTGSGGGGGGTTAGLQPPPRPSGASAGDGTGKLYGTTHLYIGTKTRAGAESADAWKDYGYDLDGQSTSSDFSNHCKPAGGAAPNNVFPDGNNGIDNAFGKVLLPVIKTAAQTSTPDLEGSLNDSIASGSFNIMLDLANLGDGTDYDPIDAYLYAGKNGVGSAWEAAPEFLKDPTNADMTAALHSSQVHFTSSYTNANTWVSGDKGTVGLKLGIAGFSLDLNIRSAVITMELAADHSGATNGVIAGVLDTEELIAQLRDVLGAVDPSFCEGAAVEGILNQIRQASDIMKDGSQDPSATCDGISIGLGFDASPVTISKIGDPAVPGELPCQGTGGGGTGGGGTGGAGGGG